MAAKSRRKGYESERELVLILNAAGHEARRVPLSGAQEGYPGDLIVDGQRWEVKRRAAGFKQIYEWLGDNAVLAIRADRREWLVVMTLRDWLKGDANVG